MRRRGLTPGAMAAHGDTLWLADETRPCLLEIRDRQLVEVHWWGRPESLASTATRLHADQAGVWVVAEDAVRHGEPHGQVDVMLAEPVGPTALGHGLLAAALPHSWPTRSGPDQVRLLSRTGVVAEVEVPGAVHELVPAGDGFLAHVVDHGPTSTTPLLERPARLASIGTGGDLAFGPELAKRSDSLPTLVGGSHPSVLSSVGGGWPPRLSSVLADLSPAADGLPLVPMGMWSAEQSDDRAAVVSHASDGSGYLLTVVDLATSLPVVSRVVTGHPQQVAFGTPELLWLSLVLTDDDDHRHTIVSWHLNGSGTVTDLDLRTVVPEELALPVTPPFAQLELAAQVEQQRRFFEEELRSSRTFETLDVRLEGDWPRTQVVARFRLPHRTDRVAAMAWPLFDEDGQSIGWDWTDHVAIDVDERAGGFDRIAGTTPAGHPVWLREPRGIEGLLPEE